MKITALLDALNSALAEPFALAWSQDSPRFLLVFTVIYAVVVIVAVTDQKNTRPGAEHGSAAWGDVFRLNKFYMDRHGSNLLLTQHFHIGIDGYKHMIFNSYLQGASLQTIKKRLEADGVLTARGNKKWSSESVQRILQNEKYCGDVLLQKTFIEDVLTGVSKKNTGQLPQYYIENNHEGIVTKQTFREAQAEIARRNSKSATNHRKRHRGRYNSKYALSERLVCGDCGSSYKRVTWSIHGRKQIVWRCVNRLEYGTKFCSNSPSIPETELHQAILKAVQNLAAKFTGEVADQLNGILHQIEVGESLTPQLQAQLEQNQQEFDHLLEMSLDFDENTPFLDDKLKRLSDKIKQLKTAITQSSVNSQTPSTPTNPITAKDLLITEYDDMLTARIIEKIIVKSRQDLEIIFIGGYTQQISLQ